MANYLTADALAELDQFRHQIFALREQAYARFQIDVLDNDTLSALSIYQIVHEYDPDYNINFARNGEDGKSRGVLIEQKASRVDRKKLSGKYASAAFQFHAMGNLEYDRYIFAARDKATLALVRIYDISQPANTQLVQSHLLAQRSQWLEKGRTDQSKMKRDVILLPEQLLESQLVNPTTQVINGCQVIIA